MNAPEFASAADLRRNYAAVRGRLYGRVAAYRPVPLSIAPGAVSSAPAKQGASFLHLSGMALITAYVDARREVDIHAENGHRAWGKVSAARQEAIVLIHLHCDRSESQIGSFFGIDRSTVNYSIKTYLGRHPKLASRIAPAGQEARRAVDLEAARLWRLGVGITQIARIMNVSRTRARNGIDRVECARSA